MSSFKGQVVLVVNTASRCGLTPQYRELQGLWERYRPRGLVVLGVPCNDFGAQEPGSEAEIVSFCETNYDIDFPLTTKLSVRSEEHTSELQSLMRISYAVFCLKKKT